MGYSQEVHVIIGPVGMSSQAYNYCSSQGSQLAKLMITLMATFLIASLALSSTIKTHQ
jgi:putative hemolysin